MDFCLVDGGYALVQRIERPQLQIIAEGVAVQRNLFEIAGMHQGLHTTAVVVDIRANLAELFIYKFQHSRQPVQVPQVFPGHLYAGLVTRVVVQSGPHVLQGASHLELEAELVQLGAFRILVNLFGQPANVMQGIVAEAVKLVHLALVDTVHPVHFKELLGKGRNLVHLVAIEGNDTHAQNIRDVVQALVLFTLAVQLARKTAFFLDSRLYRIDIDVVVLDTLAERVPDNGEHLRKHRTVLPELLQNGVAVGIQTITSYGFIRHKASVSLSRAGLVKQFRNQFFELVVGESSLQA